MSLAAAPRRRAAEAVRRPPAGPVLAGLGTATPPAVDQAAACARLAALWDLDAAQQARWRRIVAGSEIDRRHAVLPVERVARLTTRQRMEHYERLAPGLAGAAAARALRDAGVDARRVTDLLVVSCTGFSAPGVDTALVETLGLRPTVRRAVIGFMGCFGAVTGLRAAAGACCGDPRAIALVVCVELCSLHARCDPDPRNQVSPALFSDGAAAAVVAGAAAGGPPGAARVGRGHSRLIPEGRDWMTWRVTDAGFSMTIDRQVPAALRAAVAAFVEEAAGPRPACFVVHPGGPAILDAVDGALGLGGGRGIEAARRVLRDHGNMSSATLLFVLAEGFARGYRPPALLLAFGPGLTIDSLDLG